MRTIVTKLLKISAGAILGYVAYGILVLCGVLIKTARMHYFDKEALLAGALSPIGALGALTVGDWNYPLWLWLRDIFAYLLIISGAIWAVHRRHTS